MLIYGVGEHAKVVFECLQAQSEKVPCSFDDYSAMQSFMGVPVYKYATDIFPEILMVIAVGNNQIRKKLSEKIVHESGCVVHPSAVISPKSLIGKGSMILQHSVIQIDSKIGKHVIINTSASVDHDCDIGDFVHIAPNATLCGNVKVGEGALIGAGATVIPGISIGKWSVVGAGSVVIDHVPDNTIVVGNPAKKVLKH